MSPLTAVLAIVLAAPSAESARAVTASWSAAAALGAPDATPGADDARAWATLQPDAGPEWLELEYESPVDVGGVIIHQNLAPGAVAKVEALDEAGAATVLWEGNDTGRKFVMRIEANPKVRARRLKVTLDTRRVSGWNEIDAVGLVGRDHAVQWAGAARASSSYATASQGPLGSIVGHRVRVEHHKGIVEGVLIGQQGDLLEIERAGGRRIFVAHAALVTIEALD